MNDYIEIRLGSSFLLNAGILGFLKLLHHCGFDENKDYFLDGQTLKISHDFFEVNDVAAFYIKTMSETFMRGTKFHQILSKEERAKTLVAIEAPSKEEIKELADIYKDFTAMIDKNSFKSGYVIISEFDDIEPIDEELINAFKKEKESTSKLNLYIQLCNLLNQPKAKEVLIFKELMYSKINLFYENTSFFLAMNLKSDIRVLYEKDFIKPLIASFDESKKSAKRCIECSALVPETRSISFMIDTTDDVARKKSYYWNLTPDAYVCPMCAFLYTLVPLGFAYLGQDAVFVNNNNTIAGLRSFMSAVESRADSNEPVRVRIYKAFTNEKINALESRIDNLQVIFKSRAADHYNLNIIGKDIVHGFLKGKKQLSFLERKYVKVNKDEYINVYDEVFSNILNNRNQYNLINKLLRLEFAEGRNIYYLKNILELQVYFKGGDRMETIMKNVNWAFNVGKEMREMITRDIKASEEKDVDNHLRSCVYKLLNYISTNNVDGYIDTIIRIYEGRNIPSIFKDMRQSDELFKAIGQSYILGLKYQKYEKQDNNEGSVKEATA